MSTADPPTPPPASEVERRQQKLIQYFFLGAFLLVLWQISKLLAPFYVAILGSAILAVLVHPMHAFFLRRLSRWPNAAAILSTSLIVLIVVLPILFMGWICIKEASKIYPVAQRWVANLQALQSGTGLPPRAAELWTRANAVLASWHIDPSQLLLDNIDELGTQMSGLATKAIKNALFVGFNLLVLTFTLFFFLRDGPYIIRRLVELIPLAPAHKQAMLHRVQETLYAVLRGVLVVAVVQGTLSGVGFALFGVPFAIPLGVLATLFSPIPFVGPAAIWIPVTLGLLLNGSQEQAAYVALWHLLIVGLVDNLLRPLLISSNAKLPLLLLFFGMLGGLRLYGFAGLLVGPVLVALLLVFVNIYRQEYQWLINQPDQPEKRLP